VRHTPVSLSYHELRMFWVRGLRNGNVWRLSAVQRGFYRACMLYARRVGRILSRLLIGQLTPLMERLASSFRSKALKAGLERAREILSTSIPTWAPRVRSWLREPQYILYLGILKLNLPPTLG